MALDQDEIPGGDWYMENDRSWRVGVFLRSAVNRRAYKAGTFVTVRVFERIMSKQRLLLQIIPTASIGDAELSMFFS
jgi:hypothetical protein